MSHYTYLCSTYTASPSKFFHISLLIDVGLCPRSQTFSTNSFPLLSVNRHICPEVYCLCSTIGLARIKQGNITLLREVTETAAYAIIEGGCPYNAAADAGLPLVTSSKTGSTCGSVTSIMPSSTMIKPSSTRPVSWMITSVASPWKKLCNWLTITYLGQRARASATANSHRH